MGQRTDVAALFNQHQVLQSEGNMSGTQIFKKNHSWFKNGGSLLQTVKGPARRMSAFALLAASAFFMAANASATDSSSDIASRYRSEVAACNNGTSTQERVTCLKEAGAARSAAKNGQINQREYDYNQNALKRCDAVPAGQRDECIRMRSGEGTSSGSVGSGGIIREIVTPVIK